MPGYVNGAFYGESVHGILGCTACHWDIVSYPHKKAARVDCISCHLLGTFGAPKENAREYILSVHGKALKSGNPAAPVCQTCHGSHYVFPSRDEGSKTYRKKIPALCGSCHQDQYKQYSQSTHGTQFIEKNNTGAPTCFDCHLEHRTPNIEQPAWKLALINECGTCHTEKFDTYRKTYHGQVTELGYTTVAKCSDCHGSHTILPLQDPQSTISKENILHTCRKCHPRSTQQFTKFYAHPEEGNRKQYPLLFYPYAFMTVLLIGVFTFFFFHTFLWLYRSLKERAKGRKEGT